MKCAKGGEEWERNWGTHVSAGENCGGRQMGRVGEKEREMDCREGRIEELGEWTHRNGLVGGQQEKGCEGKEGRFVRYVVRR